MPKLPEFDASEVIRELRPNQAGEQAALLAGRRIGIAFSDIGKDIKQNFDIAQQHADTTALSNLYVNTTQLENDLNTQTDTALKDPQNAAAVQGGVAATTLIDHVKQRLDVFQAPPGSSDEVQRAYAQERARVFNNLSNRIRAGQAEMSGAYHIHNFQQTNSNLVSSVMADPSPENISEAIGINNKVFGANAPDLGATPEVQAREIALVNPGAERIALAGWEGQFQKIHDLYANAIPGTPDYQVNLQKAQQAEATTRQRLAAQENFQYITDGTEKSALPGKLEAAIKGGTESAKSTLTLAQKESDDEGRGVLADLGIKVNQAVTAGKPVPPDVQQAIYAAARKYPRLYGEFDPLLKAIPSAQRDAEAGTFTASDPKTEEAFGKRVLIPAGQPGALTVSEVIAAENGPNPRLSHDVAGRLLDQLEKLGKDPDLKQGYSDLDKFLATAIRPQLTKSPPLDASGAPTQLGVNGLPQSGPDLQGDIAYQEAYREAHQIFEGWLRAGKTPAEAVEIMSNPANNKSFYQRLQYFQNARHSGDAGSYFRAHPYANVGDSQTPAATQPTVSSGAVAPRQAGESPEAYLRRTGG